MKGEYKGEVTKQAAIDAAIDLFSQHGFSETSFQMIADRCRLSQSAILYHFKSKRVLVEAVISSITKHNHQYVDGKMNPKDSALSRLNKYLLYNVAWGADFRSHVQVLLLLYYYAFVDKNFKALHFEYLKIGKERILDHVLAAQREGDIKEEHSGEVITDMIFDFKLGVLTKAIEAQNRKRAIEQYKKVWHPFLALFLTNPEIIDDLKI